MTWGIHPAITFDKSLEIGQEVEASFATEGRPVRLRARITNLDEQTAKVELLEDGEIGWRAGRALEVPRFLSPLWSRDVGLFPAGRS
jgi:hypothetical protein